MEVRNFFEGPINLDLMIAAQAYNLLSQEKDISIEDVKDAAENFRNVLIQSIFVINEMTVNDDFN
jgi:hypothetical protein